MAARSTSSSSAAPVGVSARTVAGVAAAVAGVAAAAVLTTSYIKRRKARAVTVVPSTPADLERHFDALSAAFIAYTVARFKLPAFIPARLKRVLEYNCKGGKYFRGLLVLDTVRTLSKERGLDYAALETRAVALGWAIEVMQAYFLVSDDIMDGSTTRRGKPCWYLVEDVKLDAVNDALVLASFMQWLIRTHITDPTEQLAFSVLFEDVSYQTELGQMLDLCNQPQGQADTKLLDGFSDDAYQAYIAIIMNKTAIYTFFLPIACGMRLCGYTSERQMASARSISTEIGIKFQIQDDYLDAFGVDIGKDGTDIQDHKATWLLMMALKRIAALNAADQERQRAILKANYGKKEHKDQKDSKQQSVQAVARVKALYLELGIEEEYKMQEQTSYDKIRAMIEAEKSVLPPDVYLPILKKVHGRKK